MNSKLNAIFARRSVREYTSQPIDDQLVRDLLEAAMAAPSAVAKDPWDFIVVRDSAMRDRIASKLPNGKMLCHASVGIVVCGNLDRAHDHQLSYMLQDCSAAIENMLLAASMLGLGACWLGVHPRQERVEHIQKLFALPEPIIPVSVVSLGWPAEFPEPRTRYREEAVHYEKW